MRQIDADFIEACKKGNLEKIKLLLENGTDFRADEDCALILASENGHYKQLNYY